jgi:hypothetical protein
MNQKMIQKKEQEIERRESITSVASVADGILQRFRNKPDYLEIFMNWERVVGKDLASICAPHKAINFGADKVLILKTTNVHFLDIQYDACRILDAVNAFLQKKTFSQIRVIQKEPHC